MRRAWWLGLGLLTACADADDDGVTTLRDCDDANPRVFGGALEVCDGLDNNCDGHVDEEVSIVAFQDRDGDGFGDDARGRRVCEMPTDGVATGGDCDDQDATAFPGGVEVCDGHDDDCDGAIDQGVLLTFYADADGDGHGVSGATTEACLLPEGTSRLADDCDDADAAAWTSAPELCDGADNDCDGLIDEGAADQLLWIDADGDGYGDPTRPAGGCGAVPGLSDDPRDCDDTDAALNPGAPELDNGLDDDCDTFADELQVPGDAATVADALDLANTGDVIQLGEGLFVGSIDLRGHDVTLAGEGCGRTVLWGDGGATVTLDQGTVAHLTITGGTSAGLVVAGTASTEAFAHHLCVIGNSHHGWGGGVDLNGGTLHLDDSLVANNRTDFNGGGVHVGDNAKLFGRRLQILDNEATFTGGGLSVCSGIAEVSATVIAGNRAVYDGGGVIVCQSSTSPKKGNLTLTNLTIVSNDVSFDRTHPDSDASQGSAIIAMANTNLALKNVLISHHGQPGEVAMYAESDRTSVTTASMGLYANGDVDYRDVYDVRAVRGDPRFVAFDPSGDPLTWDLHLRAGSPYRDMGDAALLDPDGSRADIGAYGGADAADDWDAGRVGDLDADGLPDAWEAAVGLAPWRDDADEDADADGLTNGDELDAGTDPFAADTDGDGTPDGEEAADGTDPLVAADHTPQVVLIGPTPTIPGEAVTLDGSASFDEDGDALTFGWALTTRPPGSSASFATPNAALTTFNPDVAGLYGVRLTVSDGLHSVVALSAVQAFDAVVVPDDAPNLSAALATVGGTGAIALRTGTWPGNLVATGHTSLTVFGLGPDVVIDAEGSGRAASLLGAGALRIVNLTLANGRADQGGGLACFGCARAEDTGPGCDAGVATPSIALERVIVRDSVATGQGGGVFVETCDTSLVDSLVQGNVAILGGGVYVAASRADLLRTDVIGNDALLRGGGVCVKNGLQRASVRNGAIAENRAADGAAIWFEGSLDATYWGVFEQLALVGNTGAAGARGSGAVVTVYDGAARLFNSVFADNHMTWSGDAPAGAGLYLLFPDRWMDATNDWRAPVQTPSVVLAADPEWVVHSANRDGLDDVWSGGPHSPLRDVGHPDRRDLDGTRADLGPGGGADASPLARLDGVDLDADGMPDGWEWRHRLNRTVDDADLDPDGDARDNLAELAAGTDPQVAD